MKNILHLISNVFQIYVFYKFGKIFFNKLKVKKFNLFFSYVGFFVINNICFYVFHNPIINVLTNIVPYFMIFLLYEGRLLLKITAPIIIYGTAMFCDGIFYKLSHIIPINKIMFSSGVATVLFFYFISLLVTKIIGTKKGEFGKDDFVYLITLTFIPLGSIVIGNIALKSYDLKGIMACVILFAINIIVFYLYDTMLKSQIAIRENVFLGQQQKYYQSQLETIKQNQDKINFLKHDIKKHNQQIRKYATMEKISVLLEYLSDVENLVEETETFIMTGNDDFDSLVNYKLALANALGAKVTVTTNLSENIFIKSIDLNIIIGNLLDNAIEALENAMDKLIYLRIECGSQIFSLACKNTYSKLPKEGQKTTKSDIVNHGFGLKSMKLAIRKYGGLIEISNDEKYFSTKILLYNME